MFDFKKLGILVLGFFLVASSFFVLAGKGFASIKKLYDDLKNENQEIRILKENIENHVEIEEGEVFDKVRSLLDEDQLKKLVTDMEVAKKEMAAI